MEKSKSLADRAPKLGIPSGLTVKSPFEPDSYDQPASAPQSGYYIQLGAFSKIANAQSLRDKLAPARYY